MRRLNYIFVAALVLAVVFACERKPMELPQPDPDGSSSYLPIEFGVDIVDTRAPIVEGGENATLDKLGVIGYQYANQTGSNWNTAKSTTRPNVFEYQPQTLTLNGNYYDIQENEDPATGEPYSWSGNKYAFFAVYPLSHSSMILSGKAVPNTPYVTYTVDRNDEANMADVMTSARKDLTATNRYVAFHMLHRLSAVDVEVRNIYEHSWQEGEGESATTNSEEIGIEITDLVLTFNNLHYASSEIYLDESEEITVDVPVMDGEDVLVSAGTYKGLVPTFKTGDKTAEYYLINGGGFTLNDDKERVPDLDDDKRPVVHSGTPCFVPYNSDDSFQLTADPEKERNMSMFFIPQEQDDLTVTVDVKFKKKRPEDSGYLVNNNVDHEYDSDGKLISSTPALGNGTEYFFATKTTAFEQSLDEGYRYYVSLNFTSAAVSINIITAAQWTDQEINHEFE